MRKPKLPRDFPPPDERRHRIRPRTMMTLLFALIVFIILAITMIIVGSLTYLLTQMGIMTDLRNGLYGIILPIAAFALASVLIGTLVAAAISRIPLRPINDLIAGLNLLATGDYSARLHTGHHPVFQNVGTSFNTLADELQNTEVLRSDFVNNFSHEFKTPIVSIRGFAKLLRKGNLPPEQQQEYLDIIVEESGRLADMATNVLTLTKVENQNILTDVSHFNLSEQIRHCILLLEKKWSQKNLAILADFSEYEIDGNEELLKQIWINLIDNAIKFSPENGEVGITIAQAPDMTTVSVRNTGPAMTEEEQKRAFNKFWQGDSSHASHGNGIGLAIAKRITTLHRGTISIRNMPDGTVFSVELPRT